MHFVIAGGSGYVGSHLCLYLTSKQEQVTLLTHSNPAVVSRRLFKKYGAKMDEYHPMDYADYHGEGDVLINLAGESLGAKKINTRRMHVLKKSRNDVFEALYNCPTLPKIFMQASAVACYPNSANEQNENSQTDASSDFGGLSLALEENTAKLNEKFHFDAFYNLRLGIVMSRDGGFMRKLNAVPPFKLLNGNNYIPYISLDDVISAIYFLAYNKLNTHAVNLTAPSYASLNEVLQCCFKEKWLPTFPLLSCLLHTGDKRSALMLSDQKIKPQILLDAGFKFKHQNLSDI